MNLIWTAGRIYRTGDEVVCRISPNPNSAPPLLCGVATLLKVFKGWVLAATVDPTRRDIPIKGLTGKLSSYWTDCTLLYRRGSGSTGILHRNRDRKPYLGSESTYLMTHQSVFACEKVLLPDSNPTCRHSPHSHSANIIKHNLRAENSIMCRLNKAYPPFTFTLNGF